LTFQSFVFVPEEGYSGNTSFLLN